MYVIPKSMSTKATCENIKPRQSSDETSAPSCLSVRGWLLFWASLRLAVSVLWTGTLAIMTYQSFLYYWYQRQAMYVTEASDLLLSGVVAVAVQLVEFGMIVLFIVAGVKKSASLYRVYYRYCILTLIVYIIAVILCFIETYEEGLYFGEIINFTYLTFHINDLPIVDDDTLVLFGIAAILDVCLEVWLINLVKKMMKKYSQVEDKVTCESV